MTDQPHITATHTWDGPHHLPDWLHWDGTQLALPGRDDNTQPGPGWTLVRWSDGHITVASPQVAARVYGPDGMRGRLERAEAELANRASADSADAAAGSYASSNEHAIAHPQPWLHIVFTSPDPTTANTSALSLRDHLAAEFPGVGMRISSNAVEDGKGTQIAGTPDEPDAGPDELTAEEARALADQLGTDLYKAQDALAFVEECCVIADREQRTITTADVRKWLKGAQCGRQLAADGELDDTGLTEADIDRMMATGIPVHIVTAPLTWTTAQQFYEPDEDPATIQAAFEAGEKGVTAPPGVMPSAADTPQPFVLWLDASDGSVPTHDGIRWPDGAATIRHRHFGHTTTHPDPECARFQAHGKQGRIAWPAAPSCSPSVEETEPNNPAATEATDTWKEPTHPHPCTATIEGRATPGGRQVQCTREARHPENHVGPKQGSDGRVLWTDRNEGATPHKEQP